METYHHKVIHILKKNGYDAASVVIPLYVDGEAEERVLQLKAITYNLENGTVVESKLEKAGMFREKVSKNRILSKFTMPNVKEGSILEFEYTVQSDFVHHVDPWVFQSHYPTLWSEFTFAIPQFFSYNFLGRGYHPMFLSEKNDHAESFTIRDSRGAGASDIINFSAGVTNFRWAMKDVPGIREEKFTSTTGNYLSRIEFQLASQGEPLLYRNYLGSWQTVTKNLLESEGFGNWVKGRHLDNLNIIPAATGAGSIENAVKIFQNIRDNFSCTGITFIYPQQTSKEVINNRKGSVPELNLLLLAALREAGYKADAVLLSTKNHGFVYSNSPMTTSFNYVIVRLKFEGNDYLLDATEPGLSFGRLPLMCFNGHARIVNEEASAIYLNADEINESSLTQMIFIENEKGSIVGTFRKQPGYYTSVDMRGEIKKKGKEEYLKELGKTYGEGYKLSGLTVDSLDNRGVPISIKYDIQLTNNGEDLIYFNPMMAEGYRKNPFASATRNYPVEMPYASDETIILSLQVPKGYVVDELPKQALVKFDEEGKSFFEYRIQNTEGLISFRSRIKIDKAMFLPDEYETLREFFNFVVTKQNENIVLKKKN